MFLTHDYLFNFNPIAGERSIYNTCSSNKDCGGRNICDVKVKQRPNGGRAAPLAVTEGTEQAIGYCVRCVVDSDCQERARPGGHRDLGERAAAGAACKTNVRRSSLREPPASSLHGAPQENAPPTHAVSWAKEFVVALI